MIRDPRNLMLVAAAGSLALLVGAYGFQILGYAPCKMCYWQRWPHVAAVVLGALTWALREAHLGALRTLAGLGAVATVITGGIGVFHWGVEQKLWDGPASCTGGGPGLAGLSGESLLDPNAAGVLVMCDEVSWAFLGLSMPGWNAVLSFGLCALWLLAQRRIH